MGGSLSSRWSDVGMVWFGVGCLVGVVWISTCFSAGCLKIAYYGIDWGAGEFRVSCVVGDCGAG